MRPWLVISLVLTAASAATAVLADRDVFGPLPDPMPIHWNNEGKPDGWAPRSQALGWLLLPAGVMGLMILLGLVLPWLSPRKFSIDPFRQTYEHIMLLLVGLFGCIHIALLLSYLRPGFDGARLLVGGLMIFFAFLGNVMGKVKRNFYVGVRTPWTIASEVVWDRTHRVAAWLWTPGGLILGVAVLCGLPLEWSLVPFFVMVLYPVFHSLYIYKKLEKQGKLDRDAVEGPATEANA
jgi:uncharacterized membrane protein